MSVADAEALRRTLSRLRAAETDNYVHVSRDEVYAALGIGRAGEIAAMDLEGLSRQEKEDLRRLVHDLGLAKLPPIYPADRKFAESFENLNLPNVSQLRSRLGYPHYHTRDSILADLRGFASHAILEHFDSYRKEHPDGEGFAHSFLSRVAVRQVNDWRERIRRVLSYSRYEDWDGAAVTRFADAAIEDLLRWFLINPKEFLLSPQDAAAWSRSLWSAHQASLATRFFAGVFGHLVVLCDSQQNRNLGAEAEEASRTVDGGAGPVESSRRILVDSSWYRYFFFDERGIARWVRYGATGFEKEETFDDFLTKLEGRIGWKEIVSPSGESMKSPEEVRVARLLGLYRVKLNGEEEEVFVKPIPTLGYDELVRFVESKGDGTNTLPLGKRLWLFRVSVNAEPAPTELVVRSSGRGWSDLVRPYLLRRVLVGVVRVPSAGRYPISLPNSRDPLAEIVESRESASLDELLFDAARGVLMVSAKADVALMEEPRPDQLPVRLRYPGGEVASTWESRLEEASVGLYRLDARFELPLTPALLGGRLVLSSGLVKEELGADIPSFAILGGPGGSAIPLPGTVTVSASGTNVVVLGNTPFDVCSSDGSVLARVTEGVVATVNREGSTITVTNRGVTTDLTIQDHREAFLMELVLRSATRLLRLVRRRETRLRISPVLGGGGSRWVAVAGAPLMLQVDVNPPTGQTVQVTLKRPDGTREAFEMHPGSELPIPEAFRTPGLTLVSVQTADLVPTEAELVCVGEPRLESASLIEAGHLDAAVRITGDTPFSVRWVTGTVAQWIAQPRPWRPTKEALILVRPYRTPDAMCQVEVEYAHAERTLVTEPRTASVAVPLVWVEVKHRGAKVTPDGIQNFRGEPILAVLRSAAATIRVRAECAGAEVDISRTGRSPTDLTEAFGLQRLDYPIEVGFVVREGEKPERALAQKLRVNPRYVPKLCIPDGPSWHSGVPHAVIVESPRPGQVIEVVEASGATVGTFALTDGVATVDCPQLPAELCLRDESGERLTVDNQGERQSVRIDRNDTPVRIRLLAPDGAGRFREVSQLPPHNLAPERVFVEAANHATLCVEVPSIVAALPLMHAAMAAGWRVSCSNVLDRLRDIRLGDARLEGVVPVDQAHRAGGSSNMLVLLDYDDAPSWESFLTGGPDARVIVIGPSGTFETRLSQSTAIEQLGVALKNGRLPSPHDLTGWAQSMSAGQASALGQAAMEIGLEDVLLDATIAALSGSPVSILLDSKACENLSYVISYPGLLSRVAPSRRAALRGALLTLGRGLLSSDLGFYREASPGFEILVRGWDSSASEDPRSELLTEERRRAFRLVRERKFREATDLIRCIFPMFKDDSRLQWELAAIVVDARKQGGATDEDYRTAIRTLVTLDQQKVPGREATLYRRDIESVLNQPRCPECGGLISRVTFACMWCKSSYPDAFSASRGDTAIK